MLIFRDFKQFWPDLSFWPKLQFWPDLSFWPKLQFWPDLSFWPPLFSGLAAHITNVSHLIWPKVS